MFEPIEQYILRSKTDRQKHLDLTSKCIEIGGRESREYRGLLAHFLKTTIPFGHKVYACHACNNSKCSNPQHLYWGTASENNADAYACGANMNIGERMKEKYTTEELSLIRQKSAQKRAAMKNSSRADAL